MTLQELSDNHESISILEGLLKASAGPACRLTNEYEIYEVDPHWIGVSTSADQVSYHDFQPSVDVDHVVKTLISFYTPEDTK